MVENGKYKCLSQCTTLTDLFLKPVQVLNWAIEQYKCWIFLKTFVSLPVS